MELTKKQRSDRNYRRSKKGRLTLKKYFQSPHGRAAKRRWYYKNIAKVRAQKQLSLAIRRGDIKRQPCEKCGSKKAQGHHEDYSKPLEVIWLCQFHHFEIHKKNWTREGV